MSVDAVAHFQAVRSLGGANLRWLAAIEEYWSDPRVEVELGIMAPNRCRVVGTWHKGSETHTVWGRGLVAALQRARPMCPEDDPVTT